MEQLIIYQVIETTRADYVTLIRVAHTTYPMTVKIIRVITVTT